MPCPSFQKERLKEKLEREIGAPVSVQIFGQNKFEVIPVQIISSAESQTRAGLSR
jgi:hypothetical protein